MSRLARTLLLPLSWIYGTIVWLRNVWYDRATPCVSRVDVPVISVGNMTAGGTGKTPFIEYLIKYFVGQNKKVAVLSRGYKRRSRGPVVVGSNQPDRGDSSLLGDEPYQVTRKFPMVTMVVDAKRARAATIAVKSQIPDVILLDDGFQHRALARDLDIVMIDGQTELRRVPMLPAGSRREPMGSLNRADVIAFSRITSAMPHLPVRDSGVLRLRVTFEPKRFCRLDGTDSIALHQLAGTSCLAFCGIANPDSFRNTLTSIGLDIVGFLTFSDHRYYSKSSAMRIRELSVRHNAKFIITTEKDAARLYGSEAMEILSTQPVLYLEIAAVVDEGEELFCRLLDRTLAAN